VDCSRGLTITVDLSLKTSWQKLSPARTGNGRDIGDALKLGQEAAMQQARYREALIKDMAEAMIWTRCF
jgi:hypothetical protein